MPEKTFLERTKKYFLTTALMGTLAIPALTSFYSIGTHLGPTKRTKVHAKYVMSLPPNKDHCSVVELVGYPAKVYLFEVCGTEKTYLDNCVLGDTVNLEANARGIGGIKLTNISSESIEHLCR